MKKKLYICIILAMLVIVASPSMALANTGPTTHLSIFVKNAPLDVAYVELLVSLKTLSNNDDYTEFKHNRDVPFCVDH